jgi:hypothetical protein
VRTEFIYIIQKKFSLEGAKVLFKNYKRRPEENDKRLSQ